MLFFPRETQKERDTIYTAKERVHRHLGGNKGIKTSQLCTVDLISCSQGATNICHRGRATDVTSLCERGVFPSEHRPAPCPRCRIGEPHAQHGSGVPCIWHRKKSLLFCCSQAHLSYSPWIKFQCRNPVTVWNQGKTLGKEDQWWLQSLSMTHKWILKEMRFSLENEDGRNYIIIASKHKKKGS